MWSTVPKSMNIRTQPLHISHFLKILTYTPFLKFDGFVLYLHHLLLYKDRYFPSAFPCTIPITLTCDNIMSRKSIKYWPRSERPRELLLEKGPEYVSDAGLVAILLRTGTQGHNAVSLSRHLLNHFEGLRGLLHATRKNLETIKGLGPAKIAQLLAATELAKRQLKEGLINRVKVHGPGDVAEYLSLSMGNQKEEVFQVIYLNNANIILAAEVLFKGTTNQSAVYPREIIKRAFELSASGLIFVHNHPSGEPNPSTQDVSLTRKLVGACRAVDLTPLDHIIITSNDYFSFKEHNMLD